MKIAIATNDRKTIAKRTGRAKEFAFFEIDDNGNIVNVRFEENLHKHDDDHEHHEEAYHRGQGKGQGKGLGRGQGRGLGRGRHLHHHVDAHEHHHGHHHEHGAHHHNEIIDQMKDVDLFLVRAVGKYLRQDLIDGNIPFKVVTKPDDLEGIIQKVVLEKE